MKHFNSICYKCNTINNNTFVINNVINVVFTDNLISILVVFHFLFELFNCCINGVLGHRKREMKMLLLTTTSFYYRLILLKQGY